MFKKHINASNSRQLGGKDAKKFRADLSKHYPSLTEDQLALLFPPKTHITQLRLSNRSIAYGTEDNTPLFFDPNGYGDKLLPTVYALALVPTLLPTLYTPSEVSNKILGGADLFLQGVLIPHSVLEPFLMGTPRSVSVLGNPVPFAVGTMAVSSAEAAREGWKGRGLTLMHTYGDLLWGLGHKMPPNAGFTPSKIYPVESIGSAAREGEGDGDDNGGEEEAGEGRVAAEMQGLSLQDGSAVPLSSTAAAAGTVAESACDTAAAAAAGEIDMDTLLEAAVLGGLQSVKNAELPMQTSDFYQKHMLPLRPSGITFDLKKSSYKKLSKLLDKFEKEKVLTQKEIRKQDHISAVNRSHPFIANWKGMPRVGSSGAASTNKAGGGKKSTGVTIEYLYKAPSSLRPVFGPEGLAEKDRLYAEEDVDAALISYATYYKLLSEDSKSIQLDRVFASGLWGKKEGPQEGEFLPIGDLKTRFLWKLQLWHRILRPQEGGMFLEVVRKGTVKPIHVVAERRNGRNVTAVSHVESFGFVADDLASDFQRRMKTACSISKLPGKTETDYEILMQGDLANKVVMYFTQTEGIDSKFVEVNNRLSGKKK